MCHFRFAMIHPCTSTARDNINLAWHLKHTLIACEDNIHYANFSNPCRENYMDLTLETSTKKLGTTKLLWLHFLYLAINMKPVRESQNSSVKSRKRVKSNKDKMFSVEMLNRLRKFSSKPMDSYCSTYLCNYMRVICPMLRILQERNITEFNIHVRAPFGQYSQKYVFYFSKLLF